jgi:signal transduction histidine kinase
VFIDNAVKYSQLGGAVEVRVIEELRADQAAITVEVVSNGPAATDQEKGQLFISRGRGAAARGVAESSGIGLTLARIVAEQHKGWISADQGPVTNGRAERRFRFQIPRAVTRVERGARQRLGR